MIIYFSNLPDPLILKYENTRHLVPKNNTDFHKITIYENTIIELYQPIMLSNVILNNNP